MTKAFAIAGGLCLLAVALEALCAGGDIRQRLAELRTPRFVPPLWGWVAIGLLYYVICFVVLYRVVALPQSAMRTAALVLTLAVMAINAAWNWFFFRTRNLFHAWILGLVYTVLALLLFALLLRVEKTAAGWLAPYVLYLGYANVWGYALWRLNRDQALRR